MIDRYNHNNLNKSHPYSNKKTQKPNPWAKQKMNKNPTFSNGARHIRHLNLGQGVVEGVVAIIGMQQRNDQGQNAWGHGFFRHGTRPILGAKNPTFA